MSNYDPTKLATDPNMFVRFLLGGCVVDDLVDDGEITYLFTRITSPYQVGAAIADRLSAKYANAVSKTVGPLSVSYSEARESWSSLADRLRDQDDIRGYAAASPVLAGATFADKYDEQNQTDYPHPYFTPGVMNNPETTGGSGSNNYYQRFGGGG